MKKTIYLLVLFSLLLVGTTQAQEGTKQFMPNSTDRVYILVDPGGYTNFAEYNCLERERLNIYLKAGETMNFGMKGNKSGEFRIKDPSGTIVVAAQTIPTSGAGYIANYTQAITGANGVILNGSTVTGGYTAMTYTAATTGNHYIEFDQSKTSNLYLTYFDVTVTDASNNVVTNPTDPNKSAGRLWSYQWQLTTTSFTQYPLNNDFFVFTGDEFVNRVTFHMKPYHFNFVANSFGTQNTGNLLVDRQSFNGNAFASNDVSEYKIFLNDPDQSVFPSTTLPPPVVKAWFNDVKIYDFDYNRTPQILNINPGTIDVNKNDVGCPDPNVVYFKIETNISGLSTILIDVDGDGYNVGTNDVALIANVPEGINYIPWDMKDAAGTDVSTGNFNCIPQLLARGPAHFPVMDAEGMNAVETYSVRPFEKFDPTLYWDDKNIPVAEWGDDNGGMATTDTSQYRINTDVPRIWTYYGNNGGHDNGNNNTLNSWFYAIDLGLSNLDFNVVQTGCHNGAAPIVSDIYKSAPINTDITFTAADFDDKYADGGGNPINKIKIATLPTNGTLKLSGVAISANDEILYANLANITFTPTNNWMGETTFEWNAYNGSYYADNNALVHLTINTDPTISAISDQNVCVNTSSGPIAFTVNDAAGETNPNDITVSATSSNLAVIDIAGITFGGSGTNRTITIDPVTDKSGSATITVFADDGYSTVSTTFLVLVGPSIDITGTLKVCPGDDLSLTANEAGADSYDWSFGGSSIGSSQNLTVANYDDATDAGIYSLTVVKGVCSGTADYLVEAHHKVSFTGPVDVCNGGVLDLLADEEVANSYAWRKGGTTLSSNRNFVIDPVAAGDAGTNYTLRVSKDGCTITSDPFTVTVNNCTPPTVDLSVDNTSIPENGGSAVLTATLSNTWTHDVTVTLGYTGTATNATDYTASSTTILIPAGSLSGTIDIDAYFDGVYEGDETVIADITNVEDGGNGASENGTQTETITITDNETAPTVTLSASPTSIIENGGVSTLTASLSNKTYEDVTVNLGYTGTATNGTDYGVANSITITAGNTTGTTDITATNDAIYEGSETVIADISSVSGGGATESGVQSETVTITDDETAPTVTLSASPTTIVENGGVSTLTVTLSNATYENVTVNLGYTGTATNATDYGVANSITITAGNLTGTTDITATNDAIYEGSETVITDISSVTGGGATESGVQSETVTITDDETAPTVTLSASPTSIVENGGVSTLTATLSTATYENVDVTLTYGGTATGSGTDYNAASTTITITAGNTTGTTPLTSVDDAISEGDETVIADITNVTGGDATEDGTQQETVTIQDDDGVLVTLSASPLSIIENGGVSTITATLDAATYEDVTVNLGYTGTATNGTDYGVANSITITAGNTTGTTDITATNDAIYEGNETVIVDISSVSGGNASESGTQQETVTIDDSADMPTVTLSASPTTIVENGGVSTLTATLSNATYENVTVNLGYTGTATNATDYGVANSITITAGNTTGTTDITATNDAIYEGSETVIADISSVSGGGATESGVQSETVTITDDETVPTVTLSASPTTIAENGGVSTLTATLSTATYENVDVTLTYGGTATGSGTDYNAASTTITITAGNTTGTTTITAVDDAISEGDETVIADITNVTGGDATEDGTQQETVTIQDDDGVLVTLSASPLSIIENGGVSTITATLDAATYEDVSVNLGYTGTATNGTDYGVANSITITAGNTTGTTDITATNDAIYEGNETVIVDISSVSGGNASESGTQQATVTIDDSADMPTVTLSASPTTIAENGGVSTLTATLSNATYENVTVNLGYTGTATNATDYGVANSITITAGNTTGTTDITATNDAIYEGDETVIADISSVSGGGATESGVQSETVTITDDETAPTVTLSASPTTIAENGGVSTLTATLSTATYENVIVTIGYTGTATGSGTDYNAASTTITITAGNTTGTTTITAVDDAISEGDETVIADITNVSGGGATENGTQQETVTIQDDDGPIALDDTYVIDEDGTLNDDVSTNDSGLDNTPITYTIITDVTNGTLVLNDDGTFTYTPNGDFNGDDSFVYEVCDATPTCSQATVTITVNPVNDPIYAGDDIASVNEDGTLNGTTVLINDGDNDGSTITINTTPIIGTTHGTLVINSDGTYTYTPDENFNGTDYFTYEICNNETPQECTTATVVITVNPVNDTPLAVDDFATTDEGNSVSGTVIPNDNDIDGDDLIVNTTLLSEPTNGTVVINEDGTYTYTPNDNFTGTDIFVYEVCDDGIPTLCSHAIVTITVNPAGVLYANDDVVEVNEDEVLNGTTVLVNDGDSDGSNLTVNTTPIDDVNNGTLVLNDDGTYTYTPTADFNGTDSFTYQVCNDEDPQECETATVIITVNPVNDTPIAGDDIATTEDGNPISGDVTTNDSDPDGDDLTVNTTPVTDPTNGTVVINEDGTYTYTPTGGFTGEDTFTYEVCDNGTPQECTTATVTITVNPAGGLYANDDIAIVNEDGVLNGTTVLVNDGDSDGSTLTVNTTPTVDVTNGTLVLNDDGTYTYTPTADFNGEDSFTYEVCNDEDPQECETATVTIIVQPVNDNLYANDDNATIDEDETLTGTTVLINDGDNDGSQIIVNTIPVVYPTHGTVIINSDGTYTYIPFPDFNGDDYFTYQICNDENPQECETATVTITVNPVNDSPIAGDDIVTDDNDNPISGDVTTNDFDPEGDDLIVNTTPIDGPSNGEIVINGDGTFTYTPTSGFVGTDTITYEVCDNQIPPECTTAEIIITVTEPGTLFANDDVNQVDEDGTLNGTTVLVNDGDSDGSTLTVNTTPIVDVSNGTLIINADGTYTYTPTADFNGEDSFTYEVCNDEDPQECQTAIVTITVNPINDAPNAEDDFIFTEEDVIVTGDVIPNDYDIDGDDLTVNTIPLSGPDNGTIVLNDDGTFTYTPDPGFVGTDTIVYEICDNGIPQQCDSAYIIIEVGVEGVLYANDDYATVLEDNILIGTTVLVNDGDSDGSTITVNTTPVSDVSHGILTLNWNGTFTYSPAPNYFGEDQFTYEISNDEDPQEFAQAVVYITVLPVNDPPTAVDDYVNTIANMPVTDNVLPNDSDIDGDNLVVNSTPISEPTNGSVELNTDGTFIYTPNTDFVGTDYFTYQVCDDGLPQLCSQALVIITVTEDNIPLVAYDDDATVNEDEVLNGTTVIVNDIDDAENILTVNSTPVSDVTNGTLVLNSDGTYIYTPNTDYHGIDSFEYEVSNNENPIETDVALVTITINSVNDVPVAVNDTLTGNINVDIEGDVSTNDIGLGDTTIVFAIDTDVKNGTVDFNDDGTFTYTPENDFSGADSLIYEVTDKDGETSKATVYLDVIPDENTDIVIPEGFSPNNDGRNDLFIITGLEEYPNNSITIMNRWGNKIYESAPYNNDWDGTNQIGLTVGGEELPEGTYFYILDLGNGKMEKGYIYLKK